MIYLLIALPIVIMGAGIGFLIAGFKGRQVDAIDCDLTGGKLSGEQVRGNVELFKDKIRGAVHPTLSGIKDMDEIYSEENEIIYP